MNPYKGYDYIRPGEVKLYNYIISTKGEEAGAEYIRALSPILNARMMGEVEAEAARFTKNVPVLSDLSSVLVNP
jgi:hypothetical protein